MSDTESLVIAAVDRAWSASGPLSAVHAPPATTLRPAASLPFVALAEPAIRVMTDFMQECAITVTEDRSVDDALNDMIRFGVRALLVTRDEVLSGLITSYDIQGERPLQFLQSSTFTRHRDIQVGHIMTPWQEVPALEWRAVEYARVRDILQLFQTTHTTHLVVIETTHGRRPFARGLFSRARIERQLGAQRDRALNAQAT